MYTPLLKVYKNYEKYNLSMIELSKLPKITKSRKKRLGQGHGSCKGKTSGRGTKGQKSRGKISKTIGIGGVSSLKRLPLYRGKYRNKPKTGKPLPVNLKYLSVLPEGSDVTVETLVSFHIVDERLAKLNGVKILGEGEITKKLTIKVSCSKGAQKKIEKIGGKVV